MDNNKKLLILKELFEEDGEIDLSYIDFGKTKLNLTGIKALEINNSYQKACNIIFNNNQFCQGEIRNDSQDANRIVNGCQRGLKSVINNNQECANHIENNLQEAETIFNSHQVGRSNIYNTDQSAHRAIENKRQMAKYISFVNNKAKKVLT